MAIRGGILDRQNERRLMGYWEQMGAENLRLRERRAGRPRWLRFDPTLLIAIPIAAMIWGLLAGQIWDFLNR